MAVWLGWWLAVWLVTPAAIRAATVFVTNTSDAVTAGDGCSLREAILATNSGSSIPDCGPPLPAGGHTIAFNVPDPGPDLSLPGNPHVVTIKPLTSLSGLAAPTIIDGTTQPAYGGPGPHCPGPQDAFAPGPYGPLLVVIDGDNYPANGNGLRILGSAGGSVIRGLVMNRFDATGAAAITISSSNGNTIECNLLGTNAVGSAAIHNQWGVRISGGNDNVITGNLVATGAVLGGHSGLRIEGVSAALTERTVIRNNRIGTTADGMGDLATGEGVVFLAPVGSTRDPLIEGNLISGAGTVGVGANGVGISLSETSGARIRGNRIGTNAAGTGAIPNRVGIFLSGARTTGTIIGTDGDGTGDAAERNLISGNTDNGILSNTLAAVGTANRIAGNYIGVDVTGNAALGNGTGILLISSAAGEVGEFVGTDGNGGVGDAAEGNVISGNLVRGILAHGRGTKISGNLIGLGADGVTAIGNAQQGVFISSCQAGALGDLIGTDADGVSDGLERNVISGNVGIGGVVITGTNCAGNRIAGNYLGLNATGSAAAPNSFGVRIEGLAHHNVVGTNGDGIRDDVERNVISGNLQAGVRLHAATPATADTGQNRVAGNWIGLDAGGSAVVPNGAGGVLLTSAKNNVVGSDGADPREANVIVGHTATAGSYGVRLESTATGNRVAGNFIGTNAMGSAVLPNSLGIVLASSSTATVQRNVVRSHGVRGVDLSANGTFINAGGNASTDNCVLRNLEGVRNSAAIVPVFESNWWGAGDGPSGDGPGSGDSAFGIDFDPFLASAPALPGCLPAPAIGKSFLDAQIPNGGTTQLTVTIANPSAVAATGVGFSDTLPTGLELAGAPTASGCGAGVASGADGDGSFALAGATVGPASTCVVEVLVRATSVGTKANQIVDFASAPAPTSPASNVAMLEVVPRADLAITKTDGVTTRPPGSMVTYDIAVSNLGPDDVSAVRVVDVFPASLTCSWTCTAAGAAFCGSPGAAGDIDQTVALPAGDAVTFTATCTISASATGTLTNTATTWAPAAFDPVPDNNSATDTDTLVPAADLRVSKADAPDPVVAGTNLTYTITVTNLGPNNATGLTLSDPLPPDTVFVSLSAPGWACTAPLAGATGTVSCSRAALSPGSSTLVLTVRPDRAVPAGTVLTNTVTVSSQTTDPTPGDQSATTTTTVTTSADLAVTKTDTPDPAVRGGTLTYSLRIANGGPSFAVTVSVTDTLPPGTTFVSVSPPLGWSCPTTPPVGAGGVVTCTAPTRAPGVSFIPLTVAIDPDAAGPTITNTAVVSSATPDPNPGNDSGSATTTLTSSADLSLAKVDSPDPVAPGENLTYTLTVSNAGPSSAADVSLDDTLPAETTFVSVIPPAGWSCPTTPPVGSGGAVNCTTPSLLPGDAVLLLTVTVDPGAIGPTIDNDAAVSSSTPDPVSGNESASATTAVGSPSANLSVTKTDDPDPVTPGETLTYTVTVTNSGPSNASGVTLDDTVPAETTLVAVTAAPGWSCPAVPPVAAGDTVTCTIATLPPGDAVFTLELAVDHDAVGPNIANTATVASATADPDSADDSGSSLTAVGSASADLSLAKVDTPDPVTPGETLTYTLTVTNAGPSEAAAVTVDDVLPAEARFSSVSPPAGWSCPTTPPVGASGTVTCTAATLAPGDAVLTLVVTVDPAAAGPTVSNTATVSSSTPDPAPGNETGDAATTLGVASADLSLSKADTPDPVAPGDTLTYTLTVSNAGPSSATSVTLTDALPAGTTFESVSPPPGWSCPTTPAVGANGTVICSTAALVPGAAVLTLTVAVDPGVAPGTSLSNTALVASPIVDPDSDDLSATATTLVADTSADLSVSKTDAADPLPPGATLEYTIVVTNGGPDTAAEVALTDPLPSGSTFVSLSPPAGWSCTTPAVGTTGTVSCSVATLGPGTHTFTLVVQADPGLATGTQLSNTVEVSSAVTPDPIPENGTATEQTTIDGTPPTVVHVDTVQGTGDGQLSDGEVTDAEIHQILVTFSEDVRASDATDPANYLLVERGSDGTFQTTACPSAMADDTAVALGPVTYDDTTFVATVDLAAVLPPGHYRLFVCGSTSIHDLAGNQLGGGTDFSLDFQVESGEEIVAIPTLRGAGLFALALLLAAAALLRLSRA